MAFLQDLIIDAGKNWPVVGGVLLVVAIAGGLAYKLVENRHDEASGALSLLAWCRCPGRSGRGRPDRRLRVVFGCMGRVQEAVRRIIRRTARRRVSCWWRVKPRQELAVSSRQRAPSTSSDRLWGP
jgi:hypothetical protein